ncbi:MAG: carboxymethylenebutenolidase [Tistrella sp.]|uniref:Carboxymethylenebutenolidase n=2 Tax=Tistrella TaxID=171436 RepID=A0A3B9IKL4_9PROT|nr:carboxymethylenebutenolidase [Tistrella sp.]MBA79335.1 carboxymethylenebutenolidase [Tistrella sp.]HAE47847.1 carboxymethylenebutenolidase [Tistrella mobilis]
MGSMVQITARDGGTFDAYLATAQGGSGPALVLIQEIFGVNHLMRYQADCFAAKGFTVIVPDLFWRQEPGVMITDQSEADWQKAFQLFQGFDADKGVEDIAATVDYIRGQSSTGKVGAIGWCLGGRLAFLTAARTNIDAAVAYYGVALDDNLGEAASMGGKLLMHVAAKDDFVPPESQEKIKSALADNPKVELHVYEGCNHAFARPGGANFVQEAALKADDRTLAFLKSTIA